MIKEKAEDKKAEDVVALDMRKAPSNLCDYFFICSAASTRQARAIADGIIEGLEKNKSRPWHIEGYNDGQWILLDYNSVVVHIFYSEARRFYKLERLWGDMSHIDLSRRKKTRPFLKTPPLNVSGGSTLLGKGQEGLSFGIRCKKPSSKKRSPA